ncbi:thiol reductant ABC exporter subunit CydC [Microvirga sp. W0021]|uniref:Thiol reductant ABC exporter subunit CydC n=1 Tax=Hohaiivirga grylli TaxID=3133970 RepID=A0ABV0BIZ1_9HYPH
MKRHHSKKQWQNLLIILRLFFARHRNMLSIGMLLAALTALSGLALLGISGWFISATAIAGLTVATAVSFNSFVPSSVIRLLAIVKTAARYGERLTTHDATLSTLADLREKLFRGWAEPGAARILLKRPATLLFRLTVDTDALDSVYLRILVPIGAALAATLLCALVIALFVSPLLALALALWFLLIGFGAPTLASSSASRTARRRSYGMEALRARTIDLVSGQTELAIADKLKMQCSAIVKADAYLAAADDRFNRIETATTAVFTIATAIALSATLLTVAALVDAQAISVPVATLAVLMTLSAMEPFSGLRRGALELGRTMLAASRIAPRLSSSAVSQPVNAPDGETALCLQNVTAGYEIAAEPVFKGLSLRINRGERVALVGSSGSGKSTLINLITGEISPSSGTVEAIARTRLPQKTELFRDTIRENLKLANPKASDDLLWDALEAAGLAKDIRKLPHQLDTMLGEGGLGLSGGQGRRLVIARMMLRNTPFWIFDEPTESLDHKTAQDVLNQIKTLVSDKTLLIATHIQREAALADRIIVMKDGQIISDLTKDNADFKKMFSSLKIS